MSRILLEIADVCQHDGVPTHLTSPLFLSDYGRQNAEVCHYSKFNLGDRTDELILKQHEEGSEWQVLSTHGNCHAVNVKGGSPDDIKSYEYLTYGNHVQLNVCEHVASPVFDHFHAFDRFRQFVPKLRNAQGWEDYSTRLTSRVNMVNNSVAFLTSTDLAERQVQDLF